MYRAILLVSVLLHPCAVRSQTIVTCSCDLTASACDANCCCDPDCSTSDRDTFVCSTDTLNLDSRLCVNELVFVNNLPQTAVVTDNGVFCIIRQSDTSSNFYTEPTILNSTEEFDAAAVQYPTYSYDLTASTTTSTNTFYTTGDTIDVQYVNGLQGTLVFPIAGSASLCVDSNPASFLNDQTSSCARRFNLSSSCTSGSFLDPLSYYSPSFFSIAELPIGNSTTVTLVNITVCNGSTPAPISFASETVICSNAVSSVSYQITYNSTAGISAACVVLSQTSVSTTSMVQSFSISYVAADTVANDTSARSGNPGYVIGKPLRTSRLTNGNRTLDTTVLTLLTPNTNGDSSCTGVTNTQINFGEDSRTGCLQSITSTQGCSALYNATMILLNIPTSGDVFVANYGNTLENSTTTNDWLLVSGTIPAMPPSGTAGDDAGCSGMLVGIHYDVFYANTGSLSNPQPEIIGIRYSGVSATVKYECFGTNCITGTAEQFVEISSTVTFTDASSTPSTILRQRPTVNARLPSDFFFPFSGTST